MILAIDGYEANAGVRVGIGRYAFELIDHIAKLQRGSRPAFDMVRVYVPGQVAAHMPEESAAFTYRSIPLKQFWTFIGLPMGIMTDSPRPDVIFSPTHYIPRFIRVPRVMAIMDVSYLTYPELFRVQDLHKLVHWTAYSVRHAAKIITISEFSKHAIIDSYHIPDSDIVVAYPALPDSVSKDAMAKSTDSFIHVPKRYILSVGTLQPRKNFARLIEAVSLLKDKEISLVIVGKKGWLYDEILAAPEKFGIKNRVQFLDFVPDSALPALYKNAACFVLPSLYEGFGLPVLEAMSYDVPVVVSSTSSLPEIAGDAGIYVDPEDAANIASGITQALTEPAKERSSRVATGKKRVKAFTWDLAAEKVMSVLEEVGKKGSKA